MAGEAGERSSGYDRPAITMEESFRNLMEDGKQMRAVIALGANRPPAKIQKVIFLLRDNDKYLSKYFKPKVASLGPIHHENTKYQLGEKYKRRLAYEFVEGCGESIKDGKSINLLYEVVKKIKELRECFDEEVTKKYDDKALAWMLFVDGCAILQYILCAANDKFKELNIKNDSVTFAHQDLFLLENQVPYGLLKLLMSLSGNEKELKSSIARFIQNVTSQQTEPQQKQEESSHPKPKAIEREPTHLLDLLRTTLLGSDPEKATRASGITTEVSDPSGSSKPDTPSESATRISEKQKAEESIVTIEASDPQPSSKSNPPSRKTRGIWPCKKKPREDLDWQSYRNVQELKASGIRLERSKSSCLRDISFRRGSIVLCFYPGYLSLPPIIVDDSMGPKFMNLIAYEMCLDFENDFGITSYISFLDSLIDEANDVKDLRKAQVLHNFLGSDQEVADLFNEIGTDLVPNAKAYKNVKFQIQKYYNNDWMTWMAQVFHDHFSSPWTIIAFVFVLLALTLSLTQTWFAAHPPGNN